MKIKALVLGIWLLVTSFTLCQSFSSKDFAFPDDSRVYSYSRFAEVEKQCRSFLSSASDLKPDDSRGYRLKNELSFFNGDWEQEKNGEPLMPFDDNDMPKIQSPGFSPWRLVSFEVRDINSVQILKNAVGLKGILSIGISRNTTIVSDSSPRFQMRPGLSALRIDFEGIYLERKENEGERLVCLLGDTTLPLWTYAEDFADIASSFGGLYNNQPQVLQDDQILLILKYPRVFSMTKRAILGEMKSLNGRENTKYFDKVYISAQLNHYSKYHFTHQQSKSSPCYPSRLQYEMVEDGFDSFTSSEFCNVLRQFGSQNFDLAPDWEFSGRQDYSNRLGPFQLERGSGHASWDHDNIKLIMQSIICEEETNENQTSGARFSAVMRVYPATMETYLAALRTGLSGLTLSVEGSWNSSSGQLCMVGCPGIVNSRLEECDSQVSFYFPRSFSSKQKSIIFGRISSIRIETHAYLPILFGLIKRPSDILYDYGRYYGSYLSHNYSKFELAYSFRARSQPHKVIRIIRQSLLRYPAQGDHINTLHDILCISSFVFPSSGNPPTYMEVEVLTLYSTFASETASLVGVQTGFTKYDILNVSLHLVFIESPHKFTEKPYEHMSRLFLEGIYDPLSGEMFLTGCRKALTKGMNIERGLDCLIEAKIEYPSENTRWLQLPIAKVTITSQRNEDDPLHFGQISLHTFFFRSQGHKEEVLFRNIFEGTLRIVLVSLSIATVWSQLVYMKRKPEVIPYVSLVMLALHFFGYSFPLISNSEILFRSKESFYYSLRPYDFHGYQVLLNALHYAGNILILATLLLIARIFRLVSESRRILRAQSNPAAKPSEIKVLCIALVFYIVCGEVLLPIPEPDYAMEHANPLQFWMAKVENYVRMATLDLGLIPHVIALYVCRLHVYPLRRAYVNGFVIIRLVVLIYESLRDPVVHQYSL